MTSRSSEDIIILGGGIAGLTSALALTKFAPKNTLPSTQIFEIRPEPATVGGAVNLTPNALRMLDHLGVYQVIQEKGYGKLIDELEIFDLYSTKIASSSFMGKDGKGIGDPPYKALRSTRGDALRAVLDVVKTHPNISLTCGKRTVDIQESKDNVTITFEDGEKCTAGILLGCGGIHSITRTKHVDPERKARYTGVCNAFGFADVGNDFPAPPRLIPSPTRNAQTLPSLANPKSTHPSSTHQHTRFHIITRPIFTLSHSSVITTKTLLPHLPSSFERSAIPFPAALRDGTDIPIRIVVFERWTVSARSMSLAPRAFSFADVFVSGVPYTATGVFRGLGGGTAHGVCF